MNLKQNYENACNAYLKAFCEKYEFDYDPDMWVANEVGGIVCIADYYFDLHDIAYCIDNDVSYTALISWYDYSLDAGTYGFDSINLKSWVSGCPRKSESELIEIRYMAKRIEKMKIELEKMCKTD